MFVDHHIPLARIDKSQSHEFQYLPDEQAKDDIINTLDLKKLEIRKFEGQITPIAKGWDLNAKLDATATQRCVISGAPVHTKIYTTIKRKYRPDVDAMSTDTALEHDFDDTIDMLPAGLDLNDLLNESIALAIPAFPKLPKYLEADEWSISTENYEEDLEVDIQKPFANLQKLLDKKKTSDSSE